jgi:flagellar biosynthesis/type III secretory pathway M-ring protein FliF/YscJ
MQISSHVKEGTFDSCLKRPEFIRHEGVQFMQQRLRCTWVIGQGIVLVIGLIFGSISSMAAEERSLEFSGAMSEVETAVQQGTMKLKQEASSLVKTFEEDQPLKSQREELTRWYRALQVKIELFWSKVKEFFKS